MNVDGTTLAFDDEWTMWVILRNILLLIKNMISSVSVPDRDLPSFRWGRILLLKINQDALRRLFLSWLTPQPIMNLLMSRLWSLSHHRTHSLLEHALHESWLKQGLLCSVWVNPRPRLSSSCLGLLWVFSMGDWSQWHFLAQHSYLPLSNPNVFHGISLPSPRRSRWVGSTASVRSDWLSEGLWLHQSVLHHSSCNW